MAISRREFVATTVGVAAAGARGTWAFQGAGALPDEDGYRLWLRYAPLGPAAAVYRDVARTREVKRMVTQYVHVPKTRTESYVVCTPTWKEVTRDVVVNVPEVVTKNGPILHRVL